MNQDQVKQKLLQLQNDVQDFQIIFSGKSSKKVHGLYKPDNKEIIIHNKNFNNDNALMHTAIHEFAHHIQFTTSPLPVSSKAHSSFFWNILHNLLNKAEAEGIYQSIYKSHPEFIQLTRQIKEKFLSVNGQLMKEFGQYLLKARELCQQHQVNFDDYLDRELNIQRSSAKTMMKCSSRNIDPKIGYDNMKIVAGINDPQKARQAEEAFLQGQTPDMVKTRFKEQKPKDELEHLMAEKQRIKNSIERLKIKLSEIDTQIARIK